jgi:hypothetical protein
MAGMTTEGTQRAVRRSRRLLERPVLVQAMSELAAAADQAPSPLARRHWRLRSRAGAIELLADATATRDEGHEQPRQTVIACGSALLNLRLAVAHLGIEPLVTLTPEPHQPELLARVEPGPAMEQRPVDEHLYLALGGRRALHPPFSHPFVPHEVLIRLDAAVVAEHAELIPVASANRLQRLEQISSALPAVEPPGAAAGWSVDAGAVALLVTQGDDVLDWLRAGQALQRLLLTATTAWVQARFHTRVLEVPQLRDRVRHELCPGRAPQVILELGRRSATAA